MKLSDLEIFTCLDRYSDGLQGLGAGPTMIVGPWGVVLSTDPRLAGKVPDEHRKEATRIECAKIYSGDASKIIKCTEESFELETKLLSGEIKPEDVIGRSSNTAGGDGWQKVPVAEGVVQGPRGLQRELGCFPKFLFKPNKEMTECKFDDTTLPWILAGGFSLLALLFLVRK